MQVSERPLPSRRFADGRTGPETDRPSDGGPAAGADRRDGGGDQGVLGRSGSDPRAAGSAFGGSGPGDTGRLGA